MCRCSSDFGRIDEYMQAQRFFLRHDCMRSRSVIVGIAFAVGLDHEHTRWDRDEYVEIKWENIKEGEEHNFVKRNHNTLGYGYDYSSILHYGAQEFSKNGQKTIVSKQPSVTLGGSMLSPLDIAKAKAL